MKKSDSPDEQVRILNEAIHRIWFSMMRPNVLSEKLRSLSFLDLHVVSTASDNPGLILKDIKDYLHIPHSTLSSSVSKLERMGLVRRVINRRDLRSYSIELTEEGRGVMREHERIDVEQAGGLISSLTVEERAQFIRLLQKVAADM